jgi:hypothetical protein
VVARLAGRPLSARRHAAAVLLTDAHTGEVVSLDYRKAISLGVARGAIREDRLALPPQTDLPARMKAYVIADVFPMAEREL